MTSWHSTSREQIPPLARLSVASCRKSVTSARSLAREATMALQKDRLKRILLLIHITLAVAVLIAGIVEFAVEPPLFDVAGDRIGIKDHVFQVQ